MKSMIFVTSILKITNTIFKIKVIIIKLSVLIIFQLKIINTEQN